MVSLWAQNETVRQYLDKQPGANRYGLCANICHGLAYLHQSDIVHGDIKGANILVSDEDIAMITDFDDAIFNNSSSRFAETTGLRLSVRWAAPELLEETSNKTYATDIYALGMVEIFQTILEIVTGDVPWSGEREIDVTVLVVQGKEFPPRPDELRGLRGDTVWQLLTQCWAPNPGGRPSAKSVKDTMIRVQEEPAGGAPLPSIPDIKKPVPPEIKPDTPKPPEESKEPGDIVLSRNMVSQFNWW
ncbi:unnamed protein product [Rhizoctonia solani]|uniref:Protein kinase domain-containing protein n=1 Tax=Rhizoctonia solani TaxID=456999 RepID=A0A8H3HC90_9AGAM|nr:unnamed protein product [Rhizoctonia solani]